MIASSIPRVELNGALILFFRTAPVPIEKRFDLAQRSMGFRQAVIELHCLDSSALCLFHGLGWRQKAIGSEQHVRIREAAIRESVRRVLQDGLFEVADGLFEALFRSLVPVIPALQIRLVGGRVSRGPRGQHLSG